jgi:hypothetical protein
MRPAAPRVHSDHAGRNAKPRRSTDEAAALHHLGEDPHVVEAIHTAPPIMKKSRMVYAISDVLSREARKITYNTLKVEKSRLAVTDAHTPPVQRSRRCNSQANIEPGPG